MADTNPIIPQVVLQVPTTVRSLIEALIFGARDPLSVRQVQALYEDQGVEGGEPRKIDYEEITRVVEELNAEYTTAERPYRIVQIAGGYQFATLPAYAEWLGKLFKEQMRRKLSQSSIETLAIIAYKQPITKPELESIRGVNCDYVIKTLLEKELATIVGRATTVGRPLLYGTSKEFLRHFGLNDLNDLPRPREIQEILGDSQFETERRMLEAQQGQEEKKDEDFKSRLPHIPKRKAGLDDEVKIVPKVRTRELKVKPSEAGQEPEAGQAAQEAAAKEAPEAQPSPVMEEQKPVGPGQISMVPEDVPIAENLEKGDTATMEPTEIDATEPAERAEPTVYLPPIQPIMLVGEEEPEALPREQAEEPVAQPEAAEISSLEPSVPEEVASPDEHEPTPEPTFEAERLEERITEVSEPAAIQPTEEVVDEPIEIADQAETVGVIETPVPQPVAPTIQEHPQGIAYSDTEPLSEEVLRQQRGSQPKSRWKSWKEKIQGFIKKLFG